jgi:hypothetical protein
LRVVAADAALVSALSEQRALIAGWRIALHDRADAGPIEAGALVMVDFNDTVAQWQAVESVRTAGFVGPILVVGGDASLGQFDSEPIQRPVRLGALLARIRAHKTTNPWGGATRVGPYELSIADCALRDVEQGRIVRLTELELRLLTYLIDAGGALVDREQLLEQVWGYRADADTHTVETHVWRLRQKVETDDPATRFVVTETGGYRLILAGRSEPE